MRVSGGAARRDGRRRWPAASGGGARRRTLNYSFSARFGTRSAPTRSVEDNKDGGCGEEVTEQPVDAAARVSNSGDVARAPRCTGSTTNGTGGLLTSGRKSWTALRRRDGGGGGDSMAVAEARVWLRRRTGRQRRRLDRRSGRGGAALNSPRTDPLACGPCAGVVPEADSGRQWRSPGRARQGGRDDIWARQVSDSGRRRRQFAGPAGPSLLCKAEPRSELLGCHAKGIGLRPTAAAGLLCGLERLRPAGLEGRMGGWFRNLGKGIMKGNQEIEFKHELEFRQSKTMLQHVCNI
jgi:hypothetical protein